MPSSRICSPTVDRTSMPPTLDLVRVSRRFAPISVRVSSCSTCEPYCIPAGWKDGGDAVVREELEVRVEREHRRLDVPAARVCRRYDVSAMTRWLAPPWLGSTESQRLMQCEPEVRRRGRAFRRPSPQTARAGSTPDMFHEPPYAISMSDTSLRSSSTRVTFA